MVKLPYEKKPDDKNKPIKASDVDRLIDRGAPVKKDIKDESKKWTFVHIRFSTAFLEEVDAVWPKMAGLSRTGWILQTLQKELNRLKYEKDD